VGLMRTPKEKPYSYIGFMAAADDMSTLYLIDVIYISTCNKNGNLYRFFLRP